MTPWLTLIVVSDTVKDPALLWHFFAALKLQRQDLYGVQLAVLKQSQPRESIINSFHGLPVEIWQSYNEFVGNQAVWDIFRDMSSARLRGTYHMIVHAEAVFSPGYFSRLRDYVLTHRPAIAMANMRKAIGASDPATVYDFSSRHYKSADKLASELIWWAIRNGDAQELAHVLHHTVAVPWRKEPVLPDQWSEDVYVANTELLRRLQFYHADRMLFQDVYDVMGAVLKICPLRVHHFTEACIYHCWHAKKYWVFTPEFADYFRRSPERWQGTFWSQPEYFEACEQKGEGSECACLMRHSEVGTVSRYVKDFLERNL